MKLNEDLKVRSFPEGFFFFIFCRIFVYSISAFVMVLGFVTVCRFA